MGTSSAGYDIKRSESEKRELKQLMRKGTIKERWTESTKEKRNWTQSGNTYNCTLHSSP
jgi:competence protein ComGC